ncbi:alpha/beta fold hydrolase [Leptothermofonsia sichuanensis E412]|uniref:alpha/beta fold hydrolase n=1 Tax=Leptothermofonsia sichuanensis TaxID=2917832 RepID=UPI001CA6EDE6|nr:alpha/beta fold hydrolase [Leptothermofonsia sichuanensis]QZZ20190.1 alpha/beta fold hydrolase [Leptothermofonsia sichuanensis E412]
MNQAFPGFLPSDVRHLTEPASIALAKRIRQIGLNTPLSPQPIQTTYIQQGMGSTPILLLHGFDSSILEFRRLFPLLAEHQETWGVDLLGFGFSDRPAGVQFDPPAIKTHLYSFWKTLIQQPVVLVGVSMGGAVAIDFALSYPESVEKLVLIDSAGFAQGPALGKWLIPPLGYLAAEFLRHPAVRKRVSLNAYVDSRLVTVDALLCASLHLKQPGWLPAMIAFTRSGGYTFLTDKIAQITVPTLILWGDSDRILGTADAARFKAAIAQSQLIWIPECGHVPHLEKPQTTAQHILEFIYR